MKQESNLGLVQVTQATASFCIMGAIFSLFAMVSVIFGLGRQGYGQIVKRAAAALYLGGWMFTFAFNSHRFFWNGWNGCVGKCAKRARFTIFFGIFFWT